jgi:hypothetical protein
MYIGGFKNGSLRANLMTNWQTGEYLSIIALQNDVFENFLWCSTSSLTLGTNSSSNIDMKGKSASFTPMKLQKVKWQQR